MNRIKDAFENKKAFIAYLMAGDPDLETSAAYILAAQDAGADLIEIGIPFSDPVAEGEVIQRASVRALSAGTRLNHVFEMVDSIRERMHIPMVFMTYLNPVFVYGYDRFFKRCSEIGICGIIIPDIPYEEQAEVKDAACKYQVEVITLVAPTSKHRIETIAKSAEGFLYLVSSMGVTGTRQQITTDIGAIMAQIREVTELPVAVGFGISVPEQARDYSSVANGVIVGSAIVKLIEQHGKQAHGPIAAFIGEMKSAMH